MVERILVTLRPIPRYSGILTRAQGQLGIGFSIPGKALGKRRHPSASIPPDYWTSQNGRIKPHPRTIGQAFVRVRGGTPPSELRAREGLRERVRWQLPLPELTSEMERCLHVVHHIYEFAEQHEAHAIWPQR